MITIIYQFKHNVTWHCRINQFYLFPEQLQIWIYVFLVGDHRYVVSFKKCYMCMGARRGGGQEGALAPPWKFKNMGAPRQE